ncbi:hypothetical protein JZ751_004432, partial [Albula glossodonta]
MKRFIGKTLDGHQDRFSPFHLMYGQEPRLFTEISGDMSDEAPVMPTAEEDVEAYVQQRATMDEEVFDKAQEKQKECYRRKTWKGTKRFLISPGMEVLKKDERKCGRPAMTMNPDWTTKVIEVEDNLVQLETMDGRPLKTKTPYASGPRVAAPPREAVRLTPADSSRETEDRLQVTCTVPLSPVSSQPEPGCETAEDTLEDSDVVITGVQPGQPLPASLTSRVADFRVMVLQPDTWLDDSAIDHAQAILKAKYPHVGGLYATTSLALLSHMPAPAQREDCLQWLDVQVQEGGSDCGLFAIVNSLTLCRARTMEVDVHCLCRRTVRQ